MSQWVSVEKEMPGDGVYVFCTDEDVAKMLPAADEIYTAAWDERQKFWTTEYWGDHDWMRKCAPLYWAHLPTSGGFMTIQTNGDDRRESGAGETIVEHHLKILPEHFAPVDAGIKRAELRNNDRNYRRGDILNLCEWDGHNFTGRFAIRQISHVADVSAYLPGYVLLSMENSEPAHEDLMW